MKQLIKQPKLTRKQAVFVQHVVEHPKEPYTEAAIVAYKTEDRNVARSIATENMSKPAIQSALAQYSDLVEDTLSTTVRDWGKADNTRKREIAQNAAMYIHDKVHGKATQRIEQTSTTVSITIDLSGVSLDSEVIEAE